MMPGDYKLYALNVEDLPECRFQRVTMKYALVYTDKGQPPRSIEIDEKQVGTLSEDDKTWLIDSYAAVALDYIKDHESELREIESHQARELLRALQQEQAKLEAARKG